MVHCFEDLREGDGMDCVGEVLCQLGAVAGWVLACRLWEVHSVEARTVCYAMRSYCTLPTTNKERRYIANEISPQKLQATRRCGFPLAGALGNMS